MGAQFFFLLFSSSSILCRFRLCFSIWKKTQRLRQTETQCVCKRKRNETRMKVTQRWKMSCDLNADGVLPLAWKKKTKIVTRWESVPSIAKDIQIRERLSHHLLSFFFLFCFDVFFLFHFSLISVVFLFSLCFCVCVCAFGRVAARYQASSNLMDLRQSVCTVVPSNRLHWFILCTFLCPLTLSQLYFSLSMPFAGLQNEK